MNPSAAGGSDLERFLSTLDIARRTGVHLVRSDAGLFPRPVDADWVRSLEGDEALAERLDAFASRFCRMQDMVGGDLQCRQPLCPGALRQPERDLASRTAAALK